ncbi:MAG: hypothetical protein U0640_07790 [Phycisphaerales bacterium]
MKELMRMVVHDYLNGELDVDVSFPADTVQVEHIRALRASLEVTMSLLFEDGFTIRQVREEVEQVIYSAKSCADQKQRRGEKVAPDFSIDKAE